MSRATYGENPAGLFADLGLSVKQASGNASLNCPLPGHEDSTPSFSLKVTTGEFKCHGCDQQGGPEDLARLIRGDEEAAELLIRHGYIVSHSLADSVGRDTLARLRGDAPSPQPRLTHYVYADEHGQPLFRVVRREPGLGGRTKSFHQERFDDDSGSWVRGRGSTPVVPFHLPLLLGAVSAGEAVFIVEGEKDVLALKAAGVVATTNPGGAGSWPTGWGEQYFAGADVTVVVDKDDAGQNWARAIRDDLEGVVSKLRFVEAATGKDASDHLRAELATNELREVDLGAETADDWPEVTPLEDPPPPPMPLDDLPEVLKAHVEAVAASIEVSPDLALVADLAQISTITQGLARVHVYGDWVEELSLYCLGIAASGERKSAVLRECSKPLVDFEREVQELLAPLLRDERVLQDVARKRLEGLKKQAAGPDPDKARQAEHELLRHLKEMDGRPEPADFRLLVDDATPQALAGLLAQHGCLGLVGAEGGIFETLAGRYEQQVPNIDVVLKAYDGESIRVDRVGREPQNIARPLLSIGLLVQPDVIEAAARNKAFRDRGLIPRFFLAWPGSMVGWRSLDSMPIPDRARVEWLQAIRRLAEMRVPATDQQGFVHFVRVEPRCEIEMSLSSEGMNVLRSFQAEVERALRPESGRFATIASTASKASGLAVRLAANLHLVDLGQAGLECPIPGRLVRAGCDLSRSSLNAHLRLMTCAGRSHPLRQARALYRWGSEQGDEWISQAEMLRKVRHRADAPQKSEELEAALGLLADHGFARGREMAARNARNAGRPPSAEWQFRSIGGRS